MPAPHGIFLFHFQSLLSLEKMNLLELWFGQWSLCEEV